MTFASYKVTSLDNFCNDNTSLSSEQFAVITILVLVVVGLVIIGALVYLIR